MRSSKKISKKKKFVSAEAKAAQWQQEALQDNIQSEKTFKNYSSLGNENSASFGSELTYNASNSDAPTELREPCLSNWDLLGMRTDSTAMDVSGVKAIKQAQLDPIDLMFDESSDDPDNNIELYGRLSYQTSKSNDLNTKYLTQVTPKERKEVQPGTENNSAEQEEEPDIQIGPEHQCPMPDLLDRTKFPSKPRTFKQVSSPALIDPKLIEVIELQVCMDLKINKISMEKLILMLREFNYKIPEFFIELLKDKDNSRKRLTWRKDRTRVY
mmetsp:Transcript_39294/g.45701  ORF Transcript_39294/g.45701 Transcript_39294/m.45701 type:complete len:270 (+) Transcript_39294:2-811(+)